MSFADIKGHDRALAILRESVLRKRVFSSYLFLGPDGIGKKEAAKNFAKALNCLGEEEPPCDKCTPCRKIDSGIHPDVYFVEPKGASSAIGIDRIRELIMRAGLKAYEAKKKVFVIDNAHSMNAEASNAFLKTLEEPPGDTVFILVSRSRELLLPTLVSRLSLVKFSASSPESVESILSEKFDIPKDEARILGKFSSGRIGRAIEMRRRDLIKRKNRLIDSLIVEKDGFSDAIGAYSDREELKENFEFLVSFFRDAFLCKALGNRAAIFNVDRMDAIKEYSGKYSAEKLDHLIKKIITLRSYVDYNVNAKMIIDVLANEVKKTG